MNARPASRIEDIPPCPVCAREQEDADALAALLTDYVDSLPSHQRTAPQDYAARLNLCAACDHRTQHTCTLCGCYVHARAAKKHMRCPLPGSPRWAAIEEDDHA